MDLLNFFGDVVIWSIIVGIVLLIVDKVRKPTKQ
jgi:hypothetical protein